MIKHQKVVGSLWRCAMSCLLEKIRYVRPRLIESKQKDTMKTPPRVKNELPTVFTLVSSG